MRERREAKAAVVGMRLREVRGEEIPFEGVCDGVSSMASA